jgi:peptide-methionine (S)-S-oxide reductase
MHALAATSTTLQRIALAAALLLGAGLLASWRAPAAEQAALIAAPAVDSPKVAGPAQTAVLSGGCFWGVQGVFEHVRGVRRVVSGYAGGAKSTAEYGNVSTGSTGHAESVQISFDPEQVSYGEILRVFFSVAHDPTQLNRQGPDVGSQYRSEIFYSTPEQKRIAEAYIAQLEQAHAFARPIVTRVDSLPGFYPAEEYHQDFLVHNPTYPYIVFNDLPKIENLKRVLPDYYVGRPVLLSNVIAH